MKIGYALLAPAALLMTAGPLKALPSPLVGIWGGPGIVLDVTATGAVLRQDCASARFDAINLATDGSISGFGTWEDHVPGAQPGDAAPKTAKATLTGKLQGDTIVLTLKGPHDQPQTYTLAKGKHAKIIRCL